MSSDLVDTHVWLWMQTAYVPERMRRSGTTPLAVEPVHALRTGELPEAYELELVMA